MSVNLSVADIPEISPAKLKKSKDAWVPWGDKNNYPDSLIKATKKSVIHKSFQNLKKSLIVGEGFSASEEIEEFIQNPNEYGESLDSILESLAIDLSVFESCALQVRYNAFKDKIISIDYIDVSKVRADKNLDQYERVQGYWVSADWSNLRENPPRYLDAFRFEKDKKKIKSTTQLWYFRGKGVGQQFYPDISYAGALGAIESDYNLSVFLANTIKNGFFSSAIVEINTEATEEQKRKFISDFTSKNTGSENAGKVTFVFPSQPNAVKVNPFNPSDMTSMMKEMKDEITSEIVIAHGGQSILVGVQQEGNGLGSDGNLYNTALKTYHSTVIRNLQKPVLDFLKKVLEFNGFSDFELEIKSSALIMDMAMMVDLLKPEAYVSDYGYDVEDLLNPSEESPEVPEVTDNGTDSDEAPAEDLPVL